MMPSDELASGPATATVTSAGGGHSTLVRYTWEHPADGPQDGVLLVGTPEEGAAEVTAAWSDSWHQQPGLMVLAGTRDAERIDLAAEYGGGWGWTITVELGDPLTLTMCNVIPAEHATADIAAGPYPVMVAELQREAEG
jgi:hypothetical protein